MKRNIRELLFCGSNNLKKYWRLYWYQNPGPSSILESYKEKEDGEPSSQQWPLVRQELGRYRVADERKENSVPNFAKGQSSQKTLK
jgi:hypothetical protein